MVVPVFIKQLLMGDLENFSYILGDKAAGEAFVIDPSGKHAEIVRHLQKENFELKAVLLTHGHYDHVVSVDKYEVPVYLSANEASFYTPQVRQMVRVKDGEILTVGGVSVQCVHTPGHSPGCQCFLAEGNLFTGDTLFIDAVGRTDLPGGSTKVLFESLQKLKRLPDKTMVWPGHNYGSFPHELLGSMKMHNPFLMSEDVNEFINYLG